MPKKGFTSMIITPGSNVTPIVDYSRKKKIAPNHTATHLLNFALRRTLVNETIDQRGSLVADDKLRFLSFLLVLLN